MAETFDKKKGATLPSMVVTLSWTGGPANLEGATGIIKARHQFGGTFSKDVTVLPQNVPETVNKIEIPWETVDDDALEFGLYYLEYHITFPSGKLAIFPTEGDVTYDKLDVQPSLV